MACGLVQPEVLRRGLADLLKSEERGARIGRCTPKADRGPAQREHGARCKVHHVPARARGHGGKPNVEGQRQQHMARHVVWGARAHSYDRRACSDTYQSSVPAHTVNSTFCARVGWDERCAGDLAAVVRDCD